MIHVIATFSPASNDALAAFLPFLAEFAGESASGVRGRIRRSDVDAAVAAVAAVGAHVEFSEPAEGIAAVDVATSVATEVVVAVATEVVASVAEVEADRGLVFVAVEEAVAFEFRLRGGSRRDLVEQGSMLARALAGSVSFASPATGWDGDRWCVRGSCVEAASLRLAAAVLDVSYSCHVAGEYAFGD